MYLFFVREFNDIDHITPIVWKMGQDNYPVAVYCLNPQYDLLSSNQMVGGSTNQQDSRFGPRASRRATVQGCAADYLSGRAIFLKQVNHLAATGSLSRIVERIIVRPSR